jgi:hypothetical protein
MTRVAFQKYHLEQSHKQLNYIYIYYSLQLHSMQYVCLIFLQKIILYEVSRPASQAEYQKEQAHNNNNNKKKKYVYCIRWSTVNCFNNYKRLRSKTKWI